MDDEARDYISLYTPYSVFWARMDFVVAFFMMAYMVYLGLTALVCCKLEYESALPGEGLIKITRCLIA